MTRIDPWTELATLTAALCDGEITPEQAARLEMLAGQSEEARRFFLQYVQLHGELHWDRAAGVPDPQQGPLATGHGGSARSARGVRWIVAGLAASLLLAACGWLAGRLFTRGSGGAGGEAVARLAQTLDARWAGSPQEIGNEIPSGTHLELREGLAELTFNSGARVILEGPARLDVQSTGRVFLHTGRLTAHVPAGAAGFTAAAPGLSVIDRGTEFGLSAEDSGTREVYVFAGRIELGPEDAGRAETAPWATFRAGQAVRLRQAEAGGRPQLEEIPLDSGNFVRSLPAPDAGSVAALRRLVVQNRHLMHHYTFEGTTPQERYRDKRGGLDLTDVVMRDGRGRGGIQFGVVGFDATTRAVAPARDRQAGNTGGIALQSETTFQPPPEMTVELLLKIDPAGDLREGTVAAAIATRESQKDCGFLVAAVDHGQWAQLLDGDAAWLLGEDDFAFAPGDWYYAAATFRVESGQTVVNAYAANLSRGDTSLVRLVRDRTTPGVPPASRLGIGKAFDADLAHAYPWPGELDEVAIYDSVLGEATLEEHLGAVMKGQGDSR